MREEPLLETGEGLKTHTVFTHLLVARAELYRAILGVFVHSREQFITHLRPAEVAREIGRDENETDGALRQLRSWGNLEATQDNAEQASIEAFYRVHSRDCIAAHHTHWRKDVREPGHDRTLTRQVIERLCALGLARREGELIFPVPAIGRYGLHAETLVEPGVPVSDAMNAGDFNEAFGNGSAAVLPRPGRERWQPLRSGVLNLYKYDEEEFWFEDGRLLLRGNNGAGKSRILALQLPFLSTARWRLRIVDQPVRAYSAIPWHMSANEFLAAPATVSLNPQQSTTPWSPGLADALRTTARAVFEEQVIHTLLPDLRDEPHGTASPS